MKRDIPVYEEYFAWQLVVDDDRCQGVICWDLLHGGLKAIGAKTMILATGGAGRLYVGTTNAYSCTGDGMSMALRAGVPLKDMEMMQFHPTTLSPTGVLITEGCRGEGAYLLNSEGERFLEALRAERDGARVARRHLPRRADRDRRGPRRRRQRPARPAPPRRREDPRAAARARASSRWSSPAIDPIHEPIPVRPGAHYHMGGVDTDVWGRPSSRASTRPARSPASPSTARTASAATR